MTDRTLAVFPSAPISRQSLLIFCVLMCVVIVAGNSHDRLFDAYEAAGENDQIPDEITKLSEKGCQEILSYFQVCLQTYWQDWRPMSHLACDSAKKIIGFFPDEASLRETCGDAVGATAKMLELHF